MLRLRPEVRSATLKLLELHKAELVRKIDSRAADWYSRQDLNDPANAAELVYHSLRLRDLVRARCNWSARVHHCSSMRRMTYLPQHSRSGGGCSRKQEESRPAP